MSLRLLRSTGSDRMFPVDHTPAVTTKMLHSTFLKLTFGISESSTLPGKITQWIPVSWEIWARF